MLFCKERDKILFSGWMLNLMTITTILKDDLIKDIYLKYTFGKL